MKFGNLSYIYIIWIVPLLILFYVWAFRKKRRLLADFCKVEMIGRLLPLVSTRRQAFKAALLIISVIFLILSLIRPKWGFQWEDIKRKGVDIIIALDVSNSMLAEDVNPNRLERAKREIEDLIKMLEGDRIGLVAFAGLSFVQCPLTLDYGAFQMFLDYLDTDLIPVQGTAIGEAIITASKAFVDEGRRSRALILITDGEDHQGRPLEAVKVANMEGVKIFVIGIGEEGGAPIPSGDGSGGFKKDKRGEVILSRLDKVTLQKIALETGGSYVRSVTGDMDLEKVYREGIKKELEDRELKSARRKRWEERFQWPLFIGLIFLIIEPFISERKRRK